VQGRYKSASDEIYLFQYSLNCGKKFLPEKECQTAYIFLGAGHFLSIIFSTIVRGTSQHNPGLHPSKLSMWAKSGQISLIFPLERYILCDLLLWDTGVAEKFSAFIFNDQTYLQIYKLVLVVDLLLPHLYRG
jgi:hypothetical protein